jgi:hypothetical protein
VLVGFSCRGRSFCPSCEKKRQLLWAEWLGKEVLAPVSHRHVVLTIPRLLRPLFRRRRELLTDQMAIGKILDHLGLSTPEAAKPPPPPRELVHVAEHGDGWGVPAEWE